MKSFKEYVTEGKLPSITKIAQSVGGKIGTGEDNDGSYWAYSGRCHEYRKKFKDALKDKGYKVVPHDHPNANKPGHVVEWDSEYYGLNGNPPEIHKDMFLHGHNNHYWLQVGKKHYDSMNPEGVENPHQLNFFKDKLEQ